MDLSSKSDDEIKNIITNHEAKRAWGAPIFIAALAERSRREEGGLNLDLTFSLVLEAARKENSFVTYKDVATQSQKPWDKVRWKVFDHLGTLCEREYHRVGAVVSAFVVTEPHRLDGILDGEALRGFEAMCVSLNPGEPLRGDTLVDQERRRFRTWISRNET